MQKEVAETLKAFKKASRKTWERDLSYQPQRLSPLDYIVFKILHQQFGEDSPSLFPIAIGIARKTINQAKRILSHGSL
jgi:hypothetical protein